MVKEFEFSFVFRYVALIFFQNSRGCFFAKLLIRWPYLILIFFLAFFLILLYRVWVRVKFIRASSVFNRLKIFLALLKSRLAFCQLSSNHLLLFTRRVE